jgi:bacterioferritin-associated ferredoxin
MMICHCNGLSDRDIHAAIDWMRAADPATVITPARSTARWASAPDCGGCLPLFLATMEANGNLGVPNAPPLLRGQVKETA